MREFHGGSIEEAAEKASAKLGIPVEDLEYEVLDEGSTGFLGIGARDARIQVPEVLVQPPSVYDSPSHSEVIESPEEAPEQEYEDVALEEPVEIGGAMPASEPSEAVEEAPEEVLLEIDRFLTGLVEAMGLDATVDVFDAGEVVVADVVTPQTGLFIGQKGETIDAVQHVTGVVASRFPDLTKRIVIDSEGYRQRRREALQGMAHRAARRAAREGKPVSLPPMAASERRTIHLFLSENSAVSTFSEGEEGSRHVVVVPA